MLRHLKAKGISCRRFASIGDIPGIKEASVKATSDPLQKILANLAKRAAAKPRTLKTLRSSIKHLLGEEGTEATIDRMLAELERSNAIRVTDGKVSYPS